MGKSSRIVINGRAYDATSGLPLDDGSTSTAIKVHHRATAAKSATPVAATKKPTTKPDISRTPTKRRAIKPQHSRTLRRDIVKKPTGAHDHSAGQQKSHAAVAKSPLIHKFAPHPQPISRKETTPEPVSHVVRAVHAKAAAAKPAAKAPVVARSSRELKDHLIATKLAEATPPKGRHKKPKSSRLRRPARVSSVMAASFAIMLLGGYLSYINMPHLSVRVAAAQAGVSASYPSYIPDGYRFHGPVAFSDGKVTLDFAANGGTTNYQISQKKTSWDSQAVLDNFVAAKTKDYAINSAGGLTVYTYGTNAAWVDRGILYTIDGDAPLAPTQILHIAQSL